jgi:hypothetical protein
MPRFTRADQQPEDDRAPSLSNEEHAEMLARVHAYSAPLEADPDSSLSPHDQVLKGVTRPRANATPRRRARY